ncbi:amino acid adenylation domain-containing protein [Pleurocapsa sp. PCC 7319]|uniref:non-ribosomal peptide synthetase n=1 Tax=Pleurocapsa sp. PCC 7319 TaxID=118161 RepID=UPI00034BA47F|nr:non-ribosomal peptide synthetase [Pleurocapsa sp. PCC 7319]
MSINYKSDIKSNSKTCCSILHEPFEQQVLKSPNAVAIIFEKERLTYKELDVKANQLAHYLQALGVKPGMFVGIFLDRSFDLAISILGILKAGGVCVPMDIKDPEERLRSILADCKAYVVLTNYRYLEMLPNSITNVVSVDEIRETVAKEKKSLLIRKVTSEDLAFVFYTSGSTGIPKGAMLSHQACSNGHAWAQTTLNLTMEDRILFKASVFAGLVKEFFLLLGIGGAVVIVPSAHQKDSSRLVKLIATQNVTVISITPSQLQTLIEEDLLQNCSKLKHVMCSAEPLNPKLQRFFLKSQNPKLHNTYGVTETGPYAAFMSCEREQDPVPIGKAISDVQIYILDSNLQHSPVEVPGEIYIGGKGLSKGYLNKPKLTNEKFVFNPFSNKSRDRLYKTGDIGRYLGDGNIELMGRVDRQVKIRGFRIELGEIESVITKHHAIKQVAVVMRKDASIKNYLVAYAVLHKEQSCEFSELRRYLNHKLPAYMIPTTFTILDFIPLTSSGKVDIDALPVPDRTDNNINNFFMAPRDSIEIELVKLWKELLNVKRVSTKDDFFDLGGHSLLAMRLFTQIKKKFGKNIPLIAIYQASTIEEIAKLIR